MFKKPLLIWIFLIVAGCVLFVFGMALHRAFEPMTAQNPVVNQPDIPDHFNGVAIKLPGRKGCYWDLQVEKTDNQSGIGSLQNVKGKYYRGAAMICRVSSRSGRVNWERGTMTLSGDVELIAADGQRVSADTITWDPDPELITASGHVRFVGPKVTVDTEQLTTDLNFAKVKTEGYTNSKLIMTGPDSAQERQR